MLDYESAAYAIAIGYSSHPRRTKPLDWTNMSLERIFCDSMKTLCHSEMLRGMEEKKTKFDHRRPLTRTMLARIIMDRNERSPIKLDVVIVDPDGNKVGLLSHIEGDRTNPIYIRLNGDRWEGSSYLQEPAPSTISHQASKTVPSATKIDMEPVAHTRTPSETFTPESMPSVVTERHKSSDPTNESLLEVSTSLNMLIDMLPFWMEVFDFSSNSSLRSAPGIVLSEATKLEKTLYGVLDIVRVNATSAQKHSFTTKWVAYDKQRWTVTQEDFEENEQREKERDGNKKQKQNKTRKQKQANACKQREGADSKQKELDQARQNEHEEAKQRELHAYIRLNNNHCEGCGHLQDSVSSASRLQTSNTFSDISQIDIKPVIKTAGPTASSILESTLIAAAMDKGSLESTVKLFRAATQTTIVCTRMLYCWIEVLYATNNQVCRPTVRHLITAFDKLWKIVRSLEMRNGTGTTAEEKEAFLEKWNEHLKREHDEDIEQREHEAEQREREGFQQREREKAKQEELEKAKERVREESEQKEREAAKQREREKVKEKEREKAQALATQYAAQDRYDSCSDSD